jgi:hypothetical protein
MFNLEEEVKKLKNWNKKSPPSIAKMAKIMAASLDRAASQKAFQIFNDKKFRAFLNFDQLEKIEQDRIFNELVVNAIVLLMMTLEAPDIRNLEELKEYFLLVKEELPRAHRDLLASYGIEKRYLKDWDKLIQMRYEEYDKDKLELRKAAMELEAKERGDLTVDGLEDIQLFLPVHTVAIGCHHHLCRGKTDGKDELFKLILKYLGRFYVEIRVPLEGGKITFWRRAKVKARHLFQKLAKFLAKIAGY